MKEDAFKREQAMAELARRQKAQQVVQACHRLAANPDWKLFREEITNAMGLDMPAFLPPYDPHHAAVRDGQRSVFLHFDAKLKFPSTGDANLKPKPKVKS
jgi:hypothetical protein